MVNQLLPLITPSPSNPPTTPALRREAQDQETSIRSSARRLVQLLLLHPHFIMLKHSPNRPHSSPPHRSQGTKLAINRLLLASSPPLYVPDEALRLLSQLIEEILPPEGAKLNLSA
eukprot:scaffold25813_cov57-Cyclotella_meneghiniana.AAC.3